MAKQPAYNDTVFCIDEPEAHVNPRAHGALLDAMVSLVGPGSQLWLATHSAGMMKRARDIQAEAPDDVVFLDFDVDFDTPQKLRPIAVDRDFWRRTLDVAFGDMAELVAPAQVLLCEGEPGTGVRTDFDAHCLRTIFGVEYPDTEFLGVGNDRQVQTDAHGIGRAVEALAPGTRVLGRRHLEAYLLDDEVLEALCVSVGQPRWTGLKAAKYGRE